jgi:hypothetical protein
MKMEIEVWYDQDLHNKCNFIISSVSSEKRERRKLFSSSAISPSSWCEGESYLDDTLRNIMKKSHLQIAIKMNYLINFLPYCYCLVSPDASKCDERGEFCERALSSFWCWEAKLSREFTEEILERERGSWVIDDNIN